VTYHNQSTDLNEAVQLLADNGFAGMAGDVQILLTSFSTRVTKRCVWWEVSGIVRC
jgi:hypothetical protein